MKHCYGICNGAIIYRLLWNIPQNLEDRSSCSQMFFQTGVLNNFAIFTGKHLCWSLFMIKLKAWRPTTILKRDPKTGVFLWKLFRTFFTEHHWWLLLRGKHLFQSISFYLHWSCSLKLYWKTPADCFFGDFCKVFQNILFVKHPQTTVCLISVFHPHTFIKVTS